MSIYNSIGFVSEKNQTMSYMEETNHGIYLSI